MTRRRKPERRRRAQRLGRAHAPTRDFLRNVAGVAVLGLAAIAGYQIAPFARAPLVEHSLAAAAATIDSSKTIEGRASVVDGDTIEIHGERIRFNGIDAPEFDQLCEDETGARYRCGAASASFLDGFLAAARPTRCGFVDRDRYGRFVGKCIRADGADVARTMVREGQALDWPRYSNGEYSKDQALAKAAKKGLWRGSFEKPWDFRADKRTKQNSPIAPLVSAARPTQCAIKGNISRKGEHIYHVPGQRFYNKTVISPSKGERWFCSETEAQTAGWRRSLQ